jgi:hypothetical protein
MIIPEIQFFYKLKKEAHALMKASLKSKEKYDLVVEVVFFEFTAIDNMINRERGNHEDCR